MTRFLLACTLVVVVVVVGCAPIPGDPRDWTPTELEMYGGLLSGWESQFGVAPACHSPPTLTVIPTDQFREATGFCPVGSNDCAGYPALAGYRDDTIMVDEQWDHPDHPSDILSHEIVHWLHDCSGMGEPIPHAGPGWNWINTRN